MKKFRIRSIVAGLLAAAAVVLIGTLGFLVPLNFQSRSFWLLIIIAFATYIAVHRLALGFKNFGRVRFTKRTKRAEKLKSADSTSISNRIFCSLSLSVFLYSLILQAAQCSTLQGMLLFCLFRMQTFQRIFRSLWVRIQLLLWIPRPQECSAIEKSVRFQMSSASSMSHIITIK